MKLKVLKSVVHNHKVHAPGENGKPTIIELTEEQFHEDHIGALVEGGFVEVIDGKRSKPEPAKP